MTIVQRNTQFIQFRNNFIRFTNDQIIVKIIFKEWCTLWLRRPIFSSWNLLNLHLPCYQHNLNPEIPSNWFHLSALNMTKIMCGPRCCCCCCPGHPHQHILPLESHADEKLVLYWRWSHSHSVWTTNQNPRKVLQPKPEGQAPGETAAS